MLNKYLLIKLLSQERRDGGRKTEGRLELYVYYLKLLQEECIHILLVPSKNSYAYMENGHVDKFLEE